MTDKPLVSIIVPILNGERFIRESIESIFAQTFSNWELLLVDDGSSDNSVHIARKYAEKYPEKIFFLMHEGHQNKGVSATRNLGIKHSRGELVAFLDQDDIWFPNKLERQVRIMQENPDVGIVVNPAMYWNEDGSKNPQPMSLSPYKNPPGAWVPKIIETEDNTACPSAVLVRTSVIRMVGGEEESFGLIEDTVFWVKISLVTSFYYDPEPLLLYRIHSQSMWNGAPENKRHQARIRFYIWLKQYLPSHNNTQFKVELPVIQQRLYFALVRYLINTKQFESGSAVIELIEQLPDAPKDAEWNYLVASCLHGSQIKPQEALLRYNLALNYGYDEFLISYNRGILHKQLGNIAEAKKDLLRAIELKPDEDAIKRILANMH